MTIRDKMLKAYFHVAEEMLADPEMTACARCFHRTKKEAFFVEARRLDKDGYLDGEIRGQRGESLDGISIVSHGKGY